MPRCKQKKKKTRYTSCLLSYTTQKRGSPASHTHIRNVCTPIQPYPNPHTHTHTSQSPIPYHTIRKPRACGSLLPPSLPPHINSQKPTTQSPSPSSHVHSHERAWLLEPPNSNPICRLSTHPRAA
ncbi:hypothetical protein BU24DRAFT_68713 [Aaosphaeria arxii CBS 175.79]|uniref:Uncharacterized protein n=1 Tax=Aaosphaeria arxii CBS 175.79 TaxID=1450172 RepID=A0A6A5XAV7_9PLEO|nr:uncharacterized protein BU24DRAFT_68713 [Aaosphaeria arxii CBS 175.79]KAF2009976.1 hypothetical protein BU24DRAFT_68713 [Aaosphaeria arxii CBS 175.79]